MKTIAIVKDGVIKGRYQATVDAKGIVRVAGKTPITNRDRCTDLGLDPKTVARAGKPLECLAHIGDNGYGLQIYWQDDPAFRSLEAQIYTAKKTADDAALEATVPGAPKAIELHRAASAESDRYRTDFAAMMDDGNNDGARPPDPGKHQSAEPACGSPGQPPTSGTLPQSKAAKRLGKLGG